MPVDERVEPLVRIPEAPEWQQSPRAFHRGGKLAHQPKDSTEGISLLQDSGEGRHSQVQKYRCLNWTEGKRFKGASRQRVSHPPASKIAKRLALGAIGKISRSLVGAWLQNHQEAFS